MNSYVKKILRENKCNTRHRTEVILSESSRDRYWVACNNCNIEILVKFDADYSTNKPSEVRMLLSPLGQYVF